MQQNKKKKIENKHFKIKEKESLVKGENGQIRN